MLKVWYLASLISSLSKVASSSERLRGGKQKRMKKAGGRFTIKIKMRGANEIQPKQREGKEGTASVSYIVCTSFKKLL